MDLRNAPKSENVEDRTGRTEGQKKVHTITTLLNPAHAATNFHGWLRDKGIAPPPPLIKLGKPGVVDILKGK